MVSELRDALSTIWRVAEDTVSSRTRIFFNLVKERLLSFALVLGVGVSLLSHCEHLGLRRRHVSQVAGSASARIIETVDWVISFVLITALFAFVFKMLPAVRLEWSDVAAGALLTSLLFIAGKLLLGIYLGKAGFADVYGPAGSLVVLLVWVYYSAQVVFFGAEFTRADALRCGSMLTGESRVRP
jgi:membrane protein